MELCTRTPTGSEHCYNALRWVCRRQRTCTSTHFQFELGRLKSPVTPSQPLEGVYRWRRLRWRESGHCRLVTTDSSETPSPPSSFPASSCTSRRSRTTRFSQSGMCAQSLRCAELVTYDHRLKGAIRSMEERKDTDIFGGLMVHSVVLSEVNLRSV